MLAAVLGCVAFVLSLFGASKTWLHSNGMLHDWYHLGFFVVLGFLAARSSERPWMRCALLGTALLFGFGIEYVEAMRSQWPVEWNDVHTDALGVAVGGLVGWMTQPCRRYE